MTLIVKEYLLQSQGNSLMVEENVRLKVVLKTTKIYIGASASTQRIIADKQFAVIESRLI